MIATDRLSQIDPDVLAETLSDACDEQGPCEDDSPAASPRLCDTPLFQHYVETLLSGDRPRCRRLIDRAADCGVGPRQILLELCWPAMEAVRQLYKDHRVSLAAEHMATRLNRAVVDRVCGELPMSEPNGRRAMVTCGNAEGEELGGQVAADLFEAAGFEVKFLGGGIPNDETNHLLGLWRPDLLVLFATLPTDMPAARALIDHLRDHGGHPQLQVMCCGGVYKRAAGLGEEIGADLVALDAADAVETAIENPHVRATADQQTVGKNRRARRQREKRAGVANRLAPEAATRAA